MTETNPGVRRLQQKGEARRGLQVFAWSLFDFANTAFYVLILVISYPLYFKEVVVRDSQYADFLWGLTFSISMVIVAFISPVLGSAADSGVSKKTFLFVFTALCIVSTAFLFFVDAGSVAIGMFLLILANIGFEAGLVFYDAFLPELAQSHRVGKISGIGFAMGYVGALVTLIVSFPLLSEGFVASNLLNVRISFLLAAGMFLLFAIPLFVFVQEKSVRERFRFGLIASGFRQVKQTVKEISHYKNVGRFLFSYFIYFDAINTIIIFSSIFARQSLHMDLNEIVIFFALVQTSAIIGSYSFGILADRIGQKRGLNFTLLLWLFVLVAAFFTEDKTMFFGVGAAAGLALGSSQSTSRSFMSVIIPLEKKTEFFGFYSFFGKASAILGPALFGYISSVMNQRAALVAIGLLLIIGFVLLQRVVEEPYTKELSLQ